MSVESHRQAKYSDVLRRAARGVRQERDTGNTARHICKAAVDPSVLGHSRHIVSTLREASDAVAHQSRQAAFGRSTTGSHSQIAVVDDTRRNPIACWMHSNNAPETCNAHTSAHSAASVPSGATHVNAERGGRLAASPHSRATFIPLDSPLTATIARRRRGWLSVVSMLLRSRVTLISYAETRIAAHMRLRTYRAR